MTLEETKKLKNGTFIKSNGSLGIKLSNGLYFPNDGYFDDFTILDDEILQDCKVVKCFLITEEQYNKLLLEEE